MSLSSLKGSIIGFDTETTGLNPWSSAVYAKYGMKPARPFAFVFKDVFGNSAIIRWEVNPLFCQKKSIVDIWHQFHPSNREFSRFLLLKISFLE
jgi:hypothetical protein